MLSLLCACFSTVCFPRFDTGFFLPLALSLFWATCPSSEGFEMLPALVALSPSSARRLILFNLSWRDCDQHDKSEQQENVQHYEGSIITWTSNARGPVVVLDRTSYLALSFSCVCESFLIILARLSPTGPLLSTAPASRPAPYDVWFVSELLRTAAACSKITSSTVPVPVPVPVTCIVHSELN